MKSPKLFKQHPSIPHQPLCLTVRSRLESLHRSLRHPNRTRQLMNLPRKNLLLVSVALTGLLSIIYGASAWMLERSIHSAEVQSTEQAVESVLGLLGQTYTDFTDRFPDWSSWNDTYDFIQSRDRTYIESNLAPESLARMNVDVVLYYDLSGKQVYGVGVDVAGRKAREIPQELLDQIVPGSRLLQTAPQQPAVTGLVMLPKGPMLVTAQPILNTLGQGPMRGTIIFGRYLDINRLRRLADRYELMFYPRNTVLPSAIAPIANALNQSAIVVRPRDPQTITGYTLVNDLYNHPAFMVQVDAPRDIYQQGKTNLRYLLITLSIVGIFFWVIAIVLLVRQSRLYTQVQTLNRDLESQVQDRTLKLSQALNFEALLKRITDKVRDSLDEQQILQTAVEELAQGLKIECCDTAIYDLEQKTSTIVAEYVEQLPSAMGVVFAMAATPELYKMLMQEHYVHSCFVQPTPIRPTVRETAILACPIYDDGGVIGDMWLYRQEEFHETEIRLVQQVTNQCAIAIRQARLYQAAQAQVAELERLNRLKDDFLSTVSHEMRTPMASIKMAIQMLEISLGIEGEMPNQVMGTRTNRYFKILHSECEREISLINDLLDLSRLEAGGETLVISTIEPAVWLQGLVAPFVERTRRQQQQFNVSIAENLPEFTIDLSKLERVITELLNNACKYTPAQGLIDLSVSLQQPAESELLEELELLTPSTTAVMTQSRSAVSAQPSLVFHVTNSGVQLDPNELTRIFDKFYRIPKHDPWKHGGTGLGLALVKKLVACLGGSLEVKQERDRLCFRVELPSLRE